MRTKASIVFAGAAVSTIALVFCGQGIRGPGGEQPVQKNARVAADAERNAVAAITERGGDIYWNYDARETDPNQTPLAGGVNALYYWTTGRDWDRDYDAQRPIASTRADVAFVIWVDWQCVNVRGERTLGDDDLRHVAAFRRLKRLLLDGNEAISDKGVAHIDRLGDLERLYLDGTAITDKGLERLACLEKLEYLSLNAEGIRGPGLKHLEKLDHLRFLDLSGSMIDDNAVRHLMRLKSLKDLGVPWHRMTKPAIERLERALPKCLVSSAPGYIG